MLENLKIIQGGMGIRVSSWKLAKAVSKENQLGVVSGTALDSMVARELQSGDKDGMIQHALEHFPFKDMADRVKERFFVAGGKDPFKPFKNIGMPAIKMPTPKIELMIVSNFVEVFLAKEGHSNPVGINYLEKIQLPTLPSLFGAMLAGANVVLMGAGIPSSIPGILDDLAEYRPVSLKIDVENNASGENVIQHFDPTVYIGTERPQLVRPNFLAIVSSDIVAKTLEKRATGEIQGYIVENYTAGGHNAPPRRDRKAPEGQAPYFGEKDNPNLERIRRIGKPFWLAGQFSEPNNFKQALAEGATGVQVGTPFAYCNESDIRPEIKAEVIKQSLAGTLEVKTSFEASPTGYPFKIAHLQESEFTVEALKKRKRVCDMGYLRSAYRNESGEVAWRCPAEPIEAFKDKGGNEAQTEGKLCLCNGLASTVGFAQTATNKPELPLLTSGEDLLYLNRFASEEKMQYSAKDVIEYILS